MPFMAGSSWRKSPVLASVSVVRTFDETRGEDVRRAGLVGVPTDIPRMASRSVHRAVKLSAIPQFWQPGWRPDDATESTRHQAALSPFVAMRMPFRGMNLSPGP
jgi:hypothetical protein